jgi:hypothetical protein
MPAAVAAVARMQQRIPPQAGLVACKFSHTPNGRACTHVHARALTRAHARTHHLRLRAGCCSHAIAQPLELVWLKPLAAAAMLLNTYAGAVHLRATVRERVSE